MSLRSTFATYVFWLLRNTRRFVVFLLGVTMLGAGLVMIVLPGPGILVSLLGLIILATEFAWAERALDRSRAKAAGASARVISTRRGKAALAASAAGLIAGGGFAAALVDGYRTVGLGALVAGVCALAVLVPHVQRYIEQTTPITPMPEGPTS